MPCKGAHAQRTHLAAALLCRAAHLLCMFTTFQPSNALSPNLIANNQTINSCPTLALT